MPTLYDPFPNAALEALACGLPLLTSHTCGTAELIEEGVSGYLRDALDESGLADALDQLAGQGAAMRLAARAVAEALSIETMSERLMALYRTLCAAR